MKRLLGSLLGGILISCILFSAEIYSQKKTKNIVVAVTYQTILPEGGSFKERDSLWVDFFENVIKKNEFMISQQVLFHYYGANSADVVVMTEYKKFDDIAAASKRFSELNKKFIPDKEKRRAFWKKFQSYFKGGHSDEIYMNHPKLIKYP